MIHSGPKPLRVALELARRLQQELSRQLTPDQRRDFTRVERLIDEAERNHVIEVTRLHHRANAVNGGKEAEQPAQPTARRRFWH